MVFKPAVGMQKRRVEIREERLEVREGGVLISSQVHQPTDYVGSVRAKN